MVRIGVFDWTLRLISWKLYSPVSALWCVNRIFTLAALLGVAFLIDLQTVHRMMCRSIRTCLFYFLYLIIFLGGDEKVHAKNAFQSDDSTTYSSDVKISVQEVFEQLPQTIMYNLRNEANFLFGSSEWIYEKEYLALRIPVVKGGLSYIYAIKPYNNPEGGVHLFGLQFLSDEQGSDSGTFTGRQMWINFQDWHVYGVRFDQGQITDHLTPIKLADPNWEKCAMAHKRFYITPEGEIAVKKEEVSQDGLSTPTSDSFNCVGVGGVWESLEGFFEGMNEALSQLFSDTDTFLNELSGGNGGGKGGSTKEEWTGSLPGTGYGGLEGH